MSTRLEMLQVAKLSPQLLGNATDLVRDFLLTCYADDGGFADRDGQSDLYYTVFGLDACKALNMPVAPQRMTPLVRRHGHGTELDLVHFSCWLRAFTESDLYDPSQDHEDTPWRRHLASFRRGDGGFSATPEETGGSVYGTFLALGAHEDLGIPLPDPEGTVDFVLRNALDNGGYATSPDLPVATTPTTAAAAVMLRSLGGEAHEKTVSWLRRRRHPQGGFLAAEGAPMPDLLSTAVALHALSALGHPPEDHVEVTLDFVDSLWTNRGAFHGHWADDDVDCEYTFYGLLALGHLSVLNP